MGEVVSLVVGVLAIVATLAGGVLFIVRQALGLASLKNEITLARQDFTAGARRLEEAINLLRQCHERNEEAMRDHEKESREVHHDLYSKLLTKGVG